MLHTKLKQGLVDGKPGCVQDQDINNDVLLAQSVPQLINSHWVIYIGFLGNNSCPSFLSILLQRSLGNVKLFLASTSDDDSRCSRSDESFCNVESDTGGAAGDQRRSTSLGKLGTGGVDGRVRSAVNRPGDVGGHVF